MTSGRFQDSPFETTAAPESFDAIDQQTEYVLARLVSRGVSSTALDATQLRTVLSEGFQRAASEAADTPLAELAYRGALEVLVDRIAAALTSTAREDSATEYLGVRMIVAPADVRDWICPLWPFC